MKLKSLIVVIAAALGVSGQASAAYLDGNNATGSTLILNVFDISTKASFSETLSPTFSSFSEGTTQVFNAGVGAFSSLFAGSSASNIHWEVVAVNTPGASVGDLPGDQTWSAAFTSTNTNTTFPQAVSANNMSGIGIKLNQWINLLAGHNTGGITTSTNSATETWNMNNTSPGAPFGGDFGAGNFPFSIIGTGFGSLNYFTAVSDGGNSIISQYAGSWNLASNGALTWNSASVGAVPIPAAVWLLGSGLFGLIGVARRRSGESAVVPAAA